MCVNIIIPENSSPYCNESKEFVNTYWLSRITTNRTRFYGKDPPSIETAKISYLH